MTDNGDDTVDVIVIGAGISGLYAAYRLKQKSPQLKVLVLEAKGKTKRIIRRKELMFFFVEMKIEWVVER